MILYPGFYNAFFFSYGCLCLFGVEVSQSNIFLNLVSCKVKINIQALINPKKKKRNKSMHL